MTTRILQYVGPTTNSDGEVTVNASEHSRALAGHTNAHGRALIQLLKGWEAYAEAHRLQFDAGIGDDHVTGDYWAEIGLAIKRLLDCEAGGLDCGSIAANITAAIEAQGFKTDGYSVLD
jgi:hypothetical protein